VAGDFTTLSGQEYGGLARLNPNGTTDLTFRNPGTNNPILAMALQVDGKIVFGTKLDRIRQTGRARSWPAQFRRQLGMAD